MLNQLKRKRGAQPHNRNAIKTGYHTAEAKAARKSAFEAVLAERAEREKRSAEWLQSIPAIDYDAIVANLIKLQREREKEQP
jgi:hypothetical protein